MDTYKKHFDILMEWIKERCWQGCDPFPLSVPLETPMAKVPEATTWLPGLPDDQSFLLRCHNAVASLWELPSGAKYQTADPDKTIRCKVLDSPEHTRLATLVLEAKKK